MLTRLIAYLQGITRRRSIATEIDAELQFHLEQEIAAHIARGLSPDEARRLALRDLGGLTQTTESVRDVRTVWLDALWQDLRFVARRLCREPGFTLIALFTLTLAVGANTAILGVAEAVLFRPLPYEDADRVFILQMLDRQSNQRFTMIPYSFVDAMNDLDGAVSTVGMTGAGPRVVEATPDGPRNLPTLGVSASYFQILGVAAARGRVFDEQDAGGAGRPAMLSYSAWRDRFGRDDTIIGKSVPIGNTTFDIVGVLPQGFVHPSLFVGKPEIITPMKPILRGTTGGTFHPIVRVGAGVSREQAQVQIEIAVSSIAAADPNWKNSTPILEDIRPVLYGQVSSPIMQFLLASAGLILLIGCANLANMLLLRGHRQTRETAMCLALGAQRGRLIRPILLEGIVVGLASGVLAVLATGSLFEVLIRQVPPIAYGNAPVGIHPRVAVISLAISLFSALTFAAMPAWRAVRLDVAALLHGRARTPSGRPWLGRPMLVAQVALSVVAVFGAAVAARAFISVVNVPLGFAPENVVRMSVPLSRPAGPSAARVVSVRPGVIEVEDPPAPPENAVTFYMRVVEALERHPDVLAAGASTGLPLSGAAPYTGAKLPGAEGRAGVGVEYVVPGFFETIRMSLLRGRTLTRDDLTRDPGAAVISESAAVKMFGEGNPLGQVFLEDGGTNREFQVVGVVADARHSLDRADLPRAYVFSGGGGRFTPVVRMRTRNDAVLANLKSAVRAVAPESFVEAVWWADSISSITAYRNPRFQTIVLGTFGLLALALTALGVFGVVNYAVISRTREMGVRLALGASPQSLIIFVLKGALVPVLMGLAVGGLAIRWISPLAEAQLFKVETHDPRMLAASAATVALSALAAAYLPARRAAAVDPVTALRTE